MGPAIEITLVIHPALVSPERLLALIEATSDYSPILLSIGAELEYGLLENFETQGFGEWAPLASYTIREKRRLGYGDMPDLVRTGLLKSGLTQRGAPGHKFLISSDSVVVGVYGDVVPYAQYHQSGTSRMPARIIAAIPPSQIDRIIRLITEWLGGLDGVSVEVDSPIGTNSSSWQDAIAV